MTDIPESAEGLTKLLRAKSTTTEQIYEIVNKFDDLTIYFPKKEIFVLQLIIDRWNDQKRVDFKRDYKIWELFNKMWISISDANIQKKLFKSLKFVNLLLETLQQDHLCTENLLSSLSETCELVNSTLTIEVSLDHSCKILAGTLNLIRVSSIDKFNTNARDRLISEIITLVGIENIAEINHKMSNTYCNDLLLSTITYLSTLESMDQSSSGKRLSKFLGVFVFNDWVDSTALLERFFKRKTTKLERDVAIVLFGISISFLSKQNFKELETIFTLITNSTPSVTPVLLRKLTESKKTLSQSFLEELFEKTMKNAENPDEQFWELISHMLVLDIEIGIKNTSLLFNLIDKHQEQFPEETKKIWSRVIKCHINAREFPEFVEKWMDYCEKYNDVSNCVFLSHSQFTNMISNNIFAFSTNQLIEVVGRLVDVIMLDPSNEVVKSTLKIFLLGLPKLSYTVLPELKPTLSKIFEVESNATAYFWEIRYLIAEVYDDIIPIDQLDVINEKEFSDLLGMSQSKELFYYFFKLREYKDFDFTFIVKEFIKFFKSTAEAEQYGIILDIFSNRASLVNSVFPKDDIEILIKSLLMDKNIDILGELFTDDDFFEEANVVSALIHLISRKYQDEKAILYMSKIPLQCYNKNTRIELINNLCSKEIITVDDVSLINILLSSPTFRSNIESDVKALYDITSKSLNIELQSSRTIILEKVWKNHILQIKEPNSSKFINETIANVLKNIKYPSFDIVHYEIALAIIKLSNNDITEDLVKSFIKLSISKISEVTKSGNFRLSEWIMNGLYTVYTHKLLKAEDTSAIENVIPILMNIFKGNDKSIPSKLLEDMFLLHTATFDEKLEYLYAQYMTCRLRGAKKDSILPAVEGAIQRLKNVSSYFNDGFILTVNCLKESQLSEFSDSILELYKVQLENIEKENDVAVHLFSRSVSEFYTNLSNFKENRASLLAILETYQSLLVSKPWLFNQYCIEMLFPMCEKICLLYLSDGANYDDIFISTVRMISNILLVHRIKLSNRHHLINSLLCQYLELLSREHAGLTGLSAKSLSRLIINLCEPSNINNGGSKNNRLNSKVNVIKQSLRRHVPIILVKFVHLSISSPFDSSIKKELISSIYSIFDLLSQNELTVVSSILDSSGKQYFRSLYSEYKKVGKWRED